MKNILTTLLILLSVVGFSQTKVQLEVENENGKEEYKLKVEREVNGKTEVIEKVYNSKEEMKNDPELKDLDLHLMEGHGTSVSTKGGNKKVRIKIDGDDTEGDHEMMFVTKEGENGEQVNIEVTVDEDGTKHIFKNGEEIDIKEFKHEGNQMIFISEDGNTTDLKTLDKEGHKMMFIST